VLVKDISPGVPNSSPAVFKVANGTLFFTATSQYLGRELYKTDGTAAGTVMVANSAYSYLSLTVEAAASSGNLLFYRAWEDNGCCSTNKELWRSDGTEAGTFRTKEIAAGESGSYPDWLTDVGGTLYFSASDANGIQLWRSDGTAAGTVSFRTVAPSVGGGATNLRNVKGTLFFAASDTLGTELWETDGTAAGTALTQDLNPGTASGNPASLLTAGHRLFFTATRNGETELWALSLEHQRAARGQRGRGPHDRGRRADDRSRARPPTPTATRSPTSGRTTAATSSAPTPPSRCRPPWAAIPTR
jgi:ELWxxDGT repeat protein